MLAKISGIDPLDFILKALEGEAESALEDLPEECDPETLSARHEYAAAVIAHINAIRRRSDCLPKESQSACIESTSIISARGESPETIRRGLSQNELGNEIALKSMQLAVAAVAGGLKVALKNNSKKGVQSRRQKADEIENWCKEWAMQYVGKDYTIVDEAVRKLGQRSLREPHTKNQEVRSGVISASYSP
jgi:hypothetical protein